MSGGYIARSVLCKKLMYSFFFCNGYRYIKNECKVGDVLSIHYFIVFGRKKKAFHFAGVLLSKKKCSFVVKNCFDGEFVEISFSYLSPAVVNVCKSPKYNLKFNSYRPNLKKKLNLTVSNIDFNSYFFDVCFDMPRLILNNFFGFFKVNSFFKKKFKKIKKKFRY